MEGFFNRLLAACRKILIFGQLCAVQGCTAIFDGDKPLKMRVFRKPRFSQDEGEKAMEGFFNRLLVSEADSENIDLRLPQAATQDI